MSIEQLTLQQVAEIVDGLIAGDGTFVVGSISPLDQAGEDDLTFADTSHVADLASSKAGAALVESDGEFAVPTVRVADVQKAIYKLLCHVTKTECLPTAGIHETASVDPDARLGQDVAIGPGAAVGAGASLGDRTVLLANAVVANGCAVGNDCTLSEGAVVRSRSVLGNRVRIGPNSVIGYDGFGFQTIDGVHRRFPHIGNVVIDDDVEIDACTCVDRAKIGSTRIGRGTKIDNLVQIAHNCRIGPGSILAGMVGLAGSATLGKYCVLAGHSGVRDHATLGDGVQLGANTVALRDVPAGQKYLGVPARPMRDTMRIWHSSPKVPDLIKHVKKLEARLASLESSQAKND